MNARVSCVAAGHGLREAQLVALSQSQIAEQRMKLEGSTA
jgi:hypothetical protein